MTEDTIIGKIFEGRTIDRTVQLDNGLIEIGFTDNTFERVHCNDFASFCEFLGDMEGVNVINVEMPEEQAETEVTPEAETEVTPEPEVTI